MKVKVLSSLTKIFVVSGMLLQVQAGNLDSFIEGFEKKPEYVKPLATFFTTNLNNGWFTSARASKEFGFSLGLPITAALLSKDDQISTYSYDTGCATYKLNNPGATCALPDRVSKDIPTLFGPVNGVVIYEVADQKKNSTAAATTQRSVEQPFDGFLSGLKAFPLLQLELGFSIEHTEVKIRTMPFLRGITADAVKSKISYFDLGFGVNHNLSHYIKNGKLPFDFSLAVTYSSWSVALAPQEDFTGELKIDGYASLINTYWSYPLGNTEFILELGYELGQMKSGGDLVNIETASAIKPNLKIDPRNGFRMAIGFAAHVGYDFFVSQSVGAQSATALRILNYRSKEQ